MLRSSVGFFFILQIVKACIIFLNDKILQML